MTIPANTPRNWCPSCEDVCQDHARICTVCGTELQYPPSPSAPQQQQQQQRALPPPPSVNVLHLLGDGDDLTQEMLRASRELRDRMRSIREQIQDTDQRQQDLLTQLQARRQEWQTVPAELLNPQQTMSSRPTAKETLDAIPRTVLVSQSVLFRRAVLSFNVAANQQQQQQQQQRTTTMMAVPGEFGAETANIKNACLIVAEEQPRTGEGQRLSDETVARIRQGLSSSSSSKSKPSTSSSAAAAAAAIILYLERGGGTTFVQKALLAQKAGAAAVVIGNHTAEPWPYVMKDSKQQAQKQNLTIPTVMVKLSDAQQIVSLCSSSGNSGAQEEKDKRGAWLENCQLSVQREASECVVCQDAFSMGQTVMRLPCGHVFHEPCALAWLLKHNTCPFCRWELATDNAEYEQERRRTQRTHAGSQGTASLSFHDFYG